MQCQTFEQYSVDYLEGTLTPREMHEADVHLQQCDYCRAMVADARHVSESLRQLPSKSCPNSVLEQVLQQQRITRVAWRERFAQWYGPVHVWKAGLATAVIVIAAGTVWLYQGSRHQLTPTETYSAVEVAQVKQEIELALAYVYHYTRQTSAIVEYQLASTQDVVAGPVHDILTAQFQSTQTAVRRPVQNLMHDAMTPFEAAASYLRGQESPPQ